MEGIVAVWVTIDSYDLKVEFIIYDYTVLLNNFSSPNSLI